MSFVIPNLTDHELKELLELGTLDSFDKALNAYKTMKTISPEQFNAINEYRAAFPPVLKRGGKRCRVTRRGGSRKRILNKDMKPMHKSMHKLRHRGRGGGKRRSCKKH